MKATPVNPTYITAYDPKAGKRLVFVVVGEQAVSIITGYKFKLPKKFQKELKAKRQKHGRDRQD